MQIFSFMFDVQKSYKKDLTDMQRDLIAYLVTPVVMVSVNYSFNILPSDLVVTSSFSLLVSHVPQVFLQFSAVNQFVAQ